MQISSVSAVYKSFWCRAFGNQYMLNTGMQNSGQKGICCAEIRTTENRVCRNQDMGIW